MSELAVVFFPKKMFISLIFALAHCNQKYTQKHKKWWADPTSFPPPNQNFHSWGPTLYSLIDLVIHANHLGPINLEEKKKSMPSYSNSFLNTEFFLVTVIIITGHI